MRDFKLSDWHRILFGEEPFIFLVEVVLRTVIVYLFLQIILRYMGKRMTGQLTMLEMTVMITLGAIVAAPMQMADRGILHGIVILISALVFHQAISYLGVKSSRMESVIQGKETLLIKDGVLQLSKMKEARISHQQLFAALRNQRIYNLGVVERAYLEACGLISVYTSKGPQTGLSLLPPEEQLMADDAAANDGAARVCQNCGRREDASGGGDRAECDHTWIKATKI